MAAIVNTVDLDDEEDVYLDQGLDEDAVPLFPPAAAGYNGTLQKTEDKKES